MLHSRVTIVIAVLLAVGAPATGSGASTVAGADCRPGPMPYTGIAGASLSSEIHESTDPTPVPYVRWRGTVPSFDGLPLSVDVTVPCGAAGPQPTVVMAHGFTDDKTVWEETDKSDTVHSPSRPGSNDRWNNIWFASRGYVVLNYTARGWRDSCGPDTPGRTTAGPPSSCAPFEYWIHLDDKRWEVRDAQWLAGGLVQSGIANRKRLAITGGSYGGGPASMAALLAGKVMCGATATPATLGPDPCTGRANGDLANWVTPDGSTRLDWAAPLPPYTVCHLMPWLPPGNLLLYQSFMLHTGGDVVLPSTIIEHPAATASDATAVRSGDDVVVSFGAIAGAEGYDFYGTADVDTGTNGLQPDQAFGPYPIVSASGGDTSVTIPVDDLAGYDWLGVSVYFPDGHREMLHNLVSLPGTGTTGPVTIVPGGVAVLEGDTGTTLAEVPVTLSAPSPVPVTATWRVISPGAGNPEFATDDDFVAATGTVTFAPGETLQTVTVSVVGDTAMEDDEWVAITFTNPTNATIGGFWGLGLLLVQNDDDRPTIVPGGVAAREEDNGTPLAEVPVTLSATSPVPVTTKCSVISPGARNPEFATDDDFVAATGTVTFAPGETYQEVAVPVVGDTVVEIDEWLLVAFSDPTDAILGGWSGLGLVLIQNDDVTP